MCFIINCPIICHSQHLRAQKTIMAAIGISRQYHYNNMSMWYIIFHVFEVMDFNLAKMH